MSIYVWKLGDVALARVSQEVYAKVYVVKDEKGLFHDVKVLGISANEDGSINVTKELCYYVQIHRTKKKMWLPYTCLRLAERSRPFYGPADKMPSPVKAEPSSVPKKRKIKEDITVPLNINVKINPKREPDLNSTYDLTHVPLKQAKYENSFRAFVRRGKEQLFDNFFFLLQADVDENADTLEYLLNVDASTEDKFDMVLKNIVNEKEIEKYLHQCWRYNFVQKQMDYKDGIDNSKSMSPIKTHITVHTPWCLVCGKDERLKECPDCPSSFHMACRREWLISFIHRKKPQKVDKRPVLIEKILSSTRTKTTVSKEKENVELCPSCMWGPKIGYDDIVWHKLGTCGWWPARVLTPGSIPSCLLSRSHSAHHWPLRYYGTLNHSWACASRMSLLAPSHASIMDSARDPMIQKALSDACDDYIVVYLT